MRNYTVIQDSSEISLGRANLVSNFFRPARGFQTLLPGVSQLQGLFAAGDKNGGVKYLKSGQLLDFGLILS